MAVSSRHSGDLNGQLAPFADSHQVHVRVRIDPATAELSAVQQTAAMLLNMLCRLQGVVLGVSIDCPGNISLQSRVTPLAARNLPLDQALAGVVNEIGIVPLAESSDPVLINVGQDVCEGATLNVYGEGWWGGVFTQPLPVSVRSSLPFGPYTAAAMATAEIFKLSRIRPSERIEIRDAFFSAWSYKATRTPDTSGPSKIERVDLTGTVLIGVGAVGCALLHVLWAMNFHGTLVMADNDVHGIEETNLNRYCLFGTGSVGRLKASAAQERLVDATFSIEPYDASFEALYDGRPNRFPLVLSAVDKNDARSGIQDKYPATILSASTSDLRVEVLHCGPPGAGACLRCFNPPRNMPSDDELRSELSKSPGRITVFAAELSVPEDEAKEWVDSGKCSMTGERMLELLQRQHGEPTQFAVPFASVMAGILLASEMIKMLTGAKNTLDGIFNRSSLQFFNPLAREDCRTFLARDANCPKCSREPGLSIWKSRSSAVLRQD